MHRVTRTFAVVGLVACSKHETAAKLGTGDTGSIGTADTCPKGTSRTAEGCLAEISTAVPACPTGAVAIPGDILLDLSTEPFRTQKMALQPFCLDITEVTVEAYSACVTAGACRPPLAYQADSAWACNWGRPDATNHPVNCVDWASANAYCAWRSERLPSRLEWHLATHGNGAIGAGKYSLAGENPWGRERANAPDAGRVNACGPECFPWVAAHHSNLAREYTTSHSRDFVEADGWPTTAPVGSFPRGANRFGNLDLIGNVGEWTSDVQAPWTDEEREAHAQKTKADHGLVFDGLRRVAEAMVCGGNWMHIGLPTLGGCTPFPQAFSGSPAVAGSNDSRSYDMVGFRCAK